MHRMNIEFHKKQLLAHDWSVIVKQKGRINKTIFFLLDSLTSSAAEMEKMI